MKVAIVSGASGNLGQTIIRRFVQDDYHVVGTVIPQDVTAIDFRTDRFEQSVVDLTNEVSSQHFVATVLEQHKVIDVAVLTVGGFAMGSIADTSTADVHAQYKLNFETAYNLARPIFTQMMKQDFGRIFLVGSRPGLSTAHGRGMVAYSLAKSLIFRLSEILNDEARETNVVTSVVIPSTIDTLSNRRSMPNAQFDNWVKPEQIAEVISYYCSDAASALREPILKVYNKS